MGYPDHLFRNISSRVFFGAGLVLLLAVGFPIPYAFASPPPVPAGLPPGEWDHLIITDESLVSAFTPLVRHRHDQGLRSRIVTTRDLGGWSTRAELREAIRGFVAEAAGQWGTRYILLGGDAEIIPVPLGFYESFNLSWDIPLDLYYAAPNGEWDLDGDGILGEYEDDDPDLTPVVALGRAPVANPAEARAFVDKVVAFEKGSDPANVDVLLAAEVGSPYPWTPGMPVGVDLAWMMEDVADILVGLAAIGDIQRLYQNWEGTPGAEPLSPASFLEAMRTGRHRFSGLLIHGIADTWSLGSGFLQPDQLVDLAGMDHALFMVGGAPEGADWRVEGVLESLLTMPVGGCVGGLTPSATYFLMPVNQFCEGFWSGMVEGVQTRVGDVYRQNLEAQLQTPYGQSASGQATLQCLAVSGDPALLFWPGDPGGLNPNRQVANTFTATASPNPFNPATEISFVVPGETGTRHTTVVEIFDLAGRRLTRILEADLASGPHSVQWRGRDDIGRQVGSGLFFARIRAGDAQAVVKLVLVE